MECHNTKCAAAASIRFAQEDAGDTYEAIDFLRAWDHGDFPEIRRDWPEATRKLLNELENIL